MAESSIEWTDANLAAHGDVIDHENVDQRRMTLGEAGVNPLVGIGVAFGAVAGSAARNNVSVLCFPAPADGLNVIPSISGIGTVSAAVVEGFQKIATRFERNVINSASPRYGVLPSSCAIACIGRVAVPVAGVVAGLAPSSANDVIRKPLLTSRTPSQPKRKIHRTFGFGWHVRGERSALHADSVAAIESRTILAVDQQRAPSLTAMAPFLPSGNTKFVFRYRYTDSTGRNLHSAKSTSHVHSIYAN